MKLVPIPTTQYHDYCLRLMFDCYKWDPQFLDNNTIARYALVITEEEHRKLKEYTENLDIETRRAEQYLNNHQKLARSLKLTRKLLKDIKKMDNYNPKAHIRLTRYDFHPTKEGDWAVSEVNSDVPGGFAEASLMPRVAIESLINESTEAVNKKIYYYESFGEKLVEVVKKKVPEHGRIMLVHCTSYSDDRQVMQYLGDRLTSEGYQVIYGSGVHVNFKDNKAYSILDGNEGPLDAIFRFTPLEWICDIKPKRWHGYFCTETLSCNHPISIYAQTKRFPLVWNSLEENGVDMSTWKKLLPETVEVKATKGKEGYIYKPAYGRVGEGISIKEACTTKEYKKILSDVRKHPNRFLAQKKFNSMPLTGENGESYHVCIGSYAIDGCHAGYYARISEAPRIDSRAADIPVLIEGGGIL